MLNAKEEKRFLFNRETSRSISIRMGQFLVFPSQKAAINKIYEGDKPLNMRFEIWKNFGLWYVRRVE